MSKRDTSATAEALRATAELDTLLAKVSGQRFRLIIEGNDGRTYTAAQAIAALKPRKPVCGKLHDAGFGATLCSRVAGHPGLCSSTTASRLEGLR